MRSSDRERQIHVPKILETISALKSVSNHSTPFPKARSGVRFFTALTSSPRKLRKLQSKP